ncbi:GNAT family N-acetyltransferase [Myxococcus sp. RHSTA-1-4]|uniref:GNAT family N-acetyltransferase n=1 Tax=Myxococcus sp. RHSTA-1-4 TaxID=2874601 RepID=UPI001CBAD477|nr:GNAT family N-acetyltransferase [Myxococcus sp. RHSTA-1-4]MBZ4420145.1 GNAT family N-acetyltransferase [Myxococcus sp. RHSTA-1-4]
MKAPEEGAPGAPPYQLRWLDRLEPEHAKRYLELYLRVLERDSTVGFAGPFDEATGQNIVRHLDAELRARRAHLLVAEAGERFLFQATCIQSGAPNNRHMATVYRAMVDPSERGQGLMWRTLPAFISKFRELGVDVVTLDVREGSPAEQVWRHMGFKPYGVLPDYARVHGKSYAGVYMYMTTPELVEIVRKRNLL